MDSALIPIDPMQQNVVSNFKTESENSADFDATFHLLHNFG
jgi:hypothetical protein